MSFESWLLMAKAFGLVVLPWAILLPVWLVTEPSESGQAVLAFFMILPYMVYPVAWTCGSLYGLYSHESWFSYAEVLAVGLFGGFLLPVVILLPVYLKVPMGRTANDIVLGFIVALLGVWMPLIIGSFFSGAVQDRVRLFGHDNYRSGPSPAHGRPDVTGVLSTANRIELLRDAQGLFFFFSIPLAFFLPLYLGLDHTSAGESTMIFFMILSNLLAFQIRIAPRAAVLLYPLLRPDYRTRRLTLDKAEAVVKLIYGCSVLPLMILLPLYLHADMQIDPARMLAFFLLAIPSVYVLEVIRTAHRHIRAEMPAKLGVAYFGVVMPFGILLPVWLASEPDGESKSILLAFMMSPTALCLLVSSGLTAMYQPRLPFLALDSLLSTWSWNSDFIFTIATIIAPAVLLLPVYFSADLEETPKLVTLCFIGILCGLLAVLFGISWYHRGEHGALSNNTVLDLPYASRDDVLRGPSQHDVVANGATGMMSKGDTQFISMKFKSQNWATMPGDPVKPAGRASDYVNIAEPASDFEWRAGMRCKAPFEADDKLYEAIIRSIDYIAGTAVVEYIGYEGDDATVAVADLFESSSLSSSSLVTA